MPAAAPQAYQASVKAREEDQLDESTETKSLKVDEEYTEGARGADDKAETFPFKLHRMLTEAEEQGNDSVLSFLPGGKGFAIHEPRSFVSDIMPQYFTTNRMSSFQRQLNLYGFRRVTDGPNKGAYFHESFSRDKKHDCKHIKRKKAASKSPLQVPVGPMAAIRQQMASNLQTDLMTRLSIMAAGATSPPPPAAPANGALNPQIVSVMLAEQQRRQQQERQQAHLIRYLLQNMKKSE